MRNLRPDVTTYTHAGCDIAIVDVADILAAAATRRVELYHEPLFPNPLRRVRLSVTPSDGTFHLSADIGAEPGDTVPGLGNDPIGVLLAKRVEAGDEWASRVVDGVSELSKRLGFGRAPAPDEEVTRTTMLDGLTAAVAYTKTRVTVHADVEELTGERIAALFGIVLGVIGEAKGVDPVTGTRYVLSRQALASAVGPDGVEEVGLDQVGGLDQVVAQFQEIAVSFRHPAVMARWGARRPQGILLYGPPGTGKTMLARALAHEIGATFKEIRTPEILDKWLGASERNIKKIFRDARRYREPTVMLFDEFDTIISYAAGGDDAAGQAINAVAGIFKQEMNTLIEDNPNVIVVATTNFPQRVDESLIRSGRFDIKLAIPAPNAAGRAEILTKMIRERIARHEIQDFRMFADDLDVDALAAAGAGLTGADLREVLRRVQLEKAMQEARTGAPATPIGQADLLRAFADLRRTAA
jgi:transitional endoplasmic reticulum ATPase